MKRHTQEIGVRKFFGEDLIELQGEGFKILDAFFGQYGNAILEGVEITATEGGLFNLSKGIVGLSVIDPKTELESIKIMPFLGATDVVLPIYITAVVEPITRVYGDNKVKPIAYNYKAEVRGLAPDTPYIEVTEASTVRFIDIILAFANNYTDAAKDNTLDSVNIKDVATLRSAKEHALQIEKSILDKVELADEDNYNRAKAFAQDLVSRLVDSSPDALNTLQELAAAMGNDADFATTMLNALATKLSKEGGEMTGGLSVPNLNAIEGIKEYDTPLSERYSRGGHTTFAVTAPGWYRIASFPSYRECFGICTVAKNYGTEPSESLSFNFGGTYPNQELVNSHAYITQMGGCNKVASKARLIVGLNEAYLEIYYAIVGDNQIYVNLSNSSHSTMIAGTAGSIPKGCFAKEVSFNNQAITVENIVVDNLHAGGIEMMNEKAIIFRSGRIRPDSGSGWAFYTHEVRNSNGDPVSGMGVYGVSNTLNYTFIGTPSFKDSSFRIYQNGTIGSKGHSTFSDETMKKDIVVIPDEVLDKVPLLRHVQYRWKDGENKRMYGHIAQESEELFPNIVSTDIHGIKSQDYDQTQNLYIAYLMRENKRLSDRLDKLE